MRGGPGGCRDDAAERAVQDALRAGDRFRIEVDLELLAGGILALDRAFPGFPPSRPVVIRSGTQCITASYNPADQALTGDDVSRLAE